MMVKLATASTSSAPARMNHDIRQPEPPKLVMIQGISGPTTISPTDEPEATTPVTTPLRARENQKPSIVCAGMLAAALPKPVSSRPVSAGA